MCNDREMFPRFRKKETNKRDHYITIIITIIIIIIKMVKGDGVWCVRVRKGSEENHYCAHILVYKIYINVLVVNSRVRTYPLLTPYQHCTYLQYNLLYNTGTLCSA